MLFKLFKYQFEFLDIILNSPIISILTVMHLSPNQGTFLTVPHSSQVNPLETPTKKGRGGFDSHLKTAESPNLPLSATKLSIADVDAE